MKIEKPFVDFYIEHGISPVSQDISDLTKHFERRASLYRHIGIPPSFVRNKKVIEFGPGSGHNAVFVSSLQPEQYVLVDANPTGLENTKNLLNEYLTENQANRIEHLFVESLIEEYQSDEDFDLVLCEGTIPFQKSPSDFLQRIARFSSSGGMVVITCVDSISYLSEILRRSIALSIVDENDTMEKKINELLPIIGPHLSTLKGMSRFHEDWILDNILQPLVGELLSIAEAIKALSADFDVYGSSPHFLTDWRWYKDIIGEQKLYNQRGIEIYEQYVHNFLDYRFTFGPRPKEKNRKLIDICDNIFRCCLEIQNGDKDILRIILQYVNQLKNYVKEFSEKTFYSLDDYSKILEHYISYNVLLPFDHFTNFFGRGQQYLSFIRR